MGGGGAERQLAYLAGPLITRGWAVHVALAAGGPNLRRLEAGGAVIHRLHPWTSADPRLLWQIARVVRRIKPDVIQVWFVQMEVAAGIVATALRIPWILSERSSAPAYPRTWKNRLRIAIARHATAIVSNSSGGDLYWGEHAHPDALRFIIPNALPLEEIAATTMAVPGALPIRAADAVIVSAGRFSSEKNLHNVLAALRRVVARPGTVAVLCGDGPLWRSLNRQIDEVGLSDRILTPGYIVDLWPLLKRADVVVAAGTFEGRPNVVLEAMAAERPLVVSDIPAHREVLDEGSALWVNPENPAAIAAAVLNVLDDPDAARRRAAAARTKVLQWTVSAAAAQYDDVYRRVVIAKADTFRDTGVVNGRRTFPPR